MASAQSGNSKLLLIIIVLLVLLLAGGGATAWFMLHKSPAESAPAKAVAPVEQPSLFYKLDPFTVNLDGGSFGDHLLYVHITLELGDKTTEDYFQKHLPQLRNRLLMVLSDQQAADLVTREGKIKLAGMIREALNKPFSKEHPKLAVRDVLFTQFIVQ